MPVALLPPLFAAIPTATDCDPCPPCAAFDPIATEDAPWFEYPATYPMAIDWLPCEVWPAPLPKAIAPAVWLIDPAEDPIAIDWKPCEVWPAPLPIAMFDVVNPNIFFNPGILVWPVPPFSTPSVPVILEAFTAVEIVCQLGIPLVSCNTCPLVPAVNKPVVLLAVWYGIEPAAPPAILVAVNAVPFKLAVILFAEKSPTASLATIV